MAAVTFDEGSWIWMPDEEEKALPAKVLGPFKPGQAGKVRTEDGEDHSLTGEITANIKPANPEVLDSKIDNLIALNDLSEEATFTTFASASNKTLSTLTCRRSA